MGPIGTWSISHHSSEKKRGKKKLLFFMKCWNCTSEQRSLCSLYLAKTFRLIIYKDFSWFNFYWQTIQYGSCRVYWEMGQKSFWVRHQRVCILNRQNPLPLDVDQFLDSLVWYMTTIKIWWPYTNSRQVSALQTLKLYRAESSEWKIMFSHFSC